MKDRGTYTATVLLRPDQEARLELLRVIYQPNKDAATLIATATLLEKFVMEGKPQGPS